MRIYGKKIGFRRECGNSAKKKDELRLAWPNRSGRRSYEAKVLSSSLSASIFFKYCRHVCVVNVSHNIMANLALVSKLLLDMRFLELKRENTWVKNDCPVWQLSDKGTSVFWGTKPSKISGVERLALVCKSFMDNAFLELKREHERSQLELFWQMYSEENLNMTMNHWCRCAECVNLGRYQHEVHEDTPEWTGRCSCLPWFEDFMENNEMDVSHGEDDKDDLVHFNILSCLDGWYWQYGSEFTKARSVADPELKKLEILFDTLYLRRN